MFVFGIEGIPVDGDEGVVGIAISPGRLSCGVANGPGVATCGAAMVDEPPNAAADAEEAAVSIKRLVKKYFVNFNVITSKKFFAT